MMEPVAAKAPELPWQEQEAAELRAELHLMKTAGIIEVAVRNPSVAEYMAHWEGRASDAEERIRELEALLKDERERGDRIAGDWFTFCEDMEVKPDTQEAVAYELKADFSNLTARAEAAEALLKEAREQRDTWTDNDRAKAWRDAFDSMHQRAMTAEAKLTQLLSYVPEECFEGDDRWELVKCNRPGGAWFGAEDFRAARAIHDKIGGKDE